MKCRDLNCDHSPLSPPPSLVQDKKRQKTFNYSHKHKLKHKHKHSHPNSKSNTNTATPTQTQTLIERKNAPLLLRI